jgi:xylulokinase
LGVPFDLYDYGPLLSRILATGAAANFPSVSNLVGDVFNAHVFVPLIQVDSAQIVPHRNALAQGYPRDGALLRTNVNGATNTGSGGLGGGHPGGQSPLGNTVFPEEDEALEMEQNGRFGGFSGSVNPGVIGSGFYGLFRKYEWRGVFRLSGRCRELPLDTDSFQNHC